MREVNSALSSSSESGVEGMMTALVHRMMEACVAPDSSPSSPHTSATPLGWANDPADPMLSPSSCEMESFPSPLSIHFLFKTKHFLALFFNFLFAHGTWLCMDMALKAEMEFLKATLPKPGLGREV